MDESLSAMVSDSSRARRMANRRNMNFPTGKAGEVVEELERRLILGYYKPGENLSFKLLAETLDVSRQPVSSAIGHLRASGYVEVLPQVGCRVVKPTSEEVFDFFRMHSAIESIGVELAVERQTLAEGECLAAIQPPPAGAFDRVAERAAYISYIDAFHEQIWAMAKSPMLAGQFSGLRNLASFYLWQGISGLAPQVAEKLNKQRKQIADLIIAGEKENASQLMREHILAKPQLVHLTDDAPEA